MLEKFDEVKKQLSELAAVLNEFKSEAVQLRILDALIGGIFSEVRPQHDRGRPERPKASKSEATSTEAGGKKKAATGSGPVATLAELATGDFFDTPRTINEIVEHCKHNLARTFKANELSGKLGRMVRNRELTRKKNTDNQYEYQKK